MLVALVMVVPLNRSRQTRCPRRAATYRLSPFTGIPDGDAWARRPRARRGDGPPGAPHGRPGRRRLVRPPGPLRVDEAGAAAAPLDDRPAVVAADLEQVDLVLAVLAQLASPDATRAVLGEALHVAVAV